MGDIANEDLGVLSREVLLSASAELNFYVPGDTSDVHMYGTHVRIHIRKAHVVVQENVGECRFDFATGKEPPGATTIER